MNRPIKVATLLLAGLALAGSLLRQEREVERLRTELAEVKTDLDEALSARLSGPASNTADSGSIRQSVEIESLRAEMDQLREKNKEADALRATVEELSEQVAAFRAGPKSSPPPDEDSEAPPELLKALLLARDSPAAAAEYVASLPAGDGQSEAALRVLGRWIRSEPQAAAAWATQFGESELRNDALALVARRWGLAEWAATADWLETLPPGQSKDAAIAAFVSSADGYDIRLAANWANRLEDSERRSQLVESTARRWLREDADAAQSWLRQTQLPDGIAERLAQTD